MIIAHFIIMIGYILEYDNDIGEDERRFYLKLFPCVDLVKDKKTHCTSCNVHLGTAPANESNIFMHPILKVSQCKKCNEFYNSGEFSKGEDGSELYCRWCGQGGEVYCCAKCPFVFCRACISLNLARSLVADIRDNENWNCFVCSPKITWPIRATHWALKNYISKQKKHIKSTINNETEQRRLLRKDSSTCCFQSKNNDETHTSKDCDTLLSQKPNLVVLKKRKAENDISNSDEPKPKQQSVPLLSKTISLSNVSLPKQTQVIATNTPTNSTLSSANLIQTAKAPFVLNNSVTVQLNKTLVPVGQTSRALTNCHVKPQNTTATQSNQSAVKIVQLQQGGPNQQSRMQMQLGSNPPPLIIRNRGVQIRPHINVVSTPSQSVNSNQLNRTTTTVQLGMRQPSDHAPVYHNIGGFCIDLNSAAQHDSIRLPNGKLIQVKKSTTNNSSQNSNLRQQIPSGVLTPILNQPQHQFTITQSAAPVQNQINNVNSIQSTAPPLQSLQQPQSIQTVPASTVLPNATGQVQIINGNIVQTMAGNISTQVRPLLVKNLYPNTPIGKARSQLQNQIFSAMEICQHLSSKLQTLTNSNPYKNASTVGDVKELYIHLSYLFTYGIGRLKSLQDICNLFKGQQTAENCSSDGDEDEIEIVEPKTTTIDLDSDNEDVETIQKSVNTQKEKNSNKTNLPNLTVRKQTQNLQRKTTTPEIRSVSLQSSQKNNAKSQGTKVQIPTSLQQKAQDNLADQSSRSPDQIGSDDDFNPLSVLACMLEVELTEGSENTVKPISTPKKPRKKVTHRSNPSLIRKKREIEVEKLKRDDLKLKQNCRVKITPLCMDSIYYRETLERYKKYRENLEKRESNEKMDIQNEQELYNSNNEHMKNTSEKEVCSAFNSENNKNKKAESSNQFRNLQNNESDNNRNKELTEVENRDQVKNLQSKEHKTQEEVENNIHVDNLQFNENSQVADLQNKNYTSRESKQSKKVERSNQSDHSCNKELSNRENELNKVKNNNQLNSLQKKDSKDLRNGSQTNNIQKKKEEKLNLKTSIKTDLCKKNGKDFPEKFVELSKTCEFVAKIELNQNDKLSEPKLSLSSEVIIHTKGNFKDEEKSSLTILEENEKSKDKVIYLHEKNLEIESIQNKEKSEEGDLNLNNFHDSDIIPEEDKIHKVELRKSLEVESNQNKVKSEEGDLNLKSSYFSDINPDKAETLNDLNLSTNLAEKSKCIELNQSINISELEIRSENEVNFESGEKEQDMIKNIENNKSTNLINNKESPNLNILNSSKIYSRPDLSLSNFQSEEENENNIEQKGTENSTQKTENKPVESKNRDINFNKEEIDVELSLGKNLSSETQLYKTENNCKQHSKDKLEKNENASTLVGAQNNENRTLDAGDPLEKNSVISTTAIKIVEDASEKNEIPHKKETNSRLTTEVCVEDNLNLSIGIKNIELSENEKEINTTKSGPVMKDKKYDEANFENNSDANKFENVLIKKTEMIES
ncbi:transcriptional regulator ATRX isoform X2 [Condylostylus longicornis]|uniref:transcriptional regulator ATRX isoform X2 n=1 Tax=Condylostylus longicornis TaxID=2530218 RepID=UPI00244E367A|nr:transcriptional regulator ATRX isoform X2 [Condylostylus longicornis]